MTDLTPQFQEAVKGAVSEQRPLQLVGGGTKSFYGRTPEGELLDLSGHRGIINYQPKELVITARAGTPLQEIESVLAEQGQMLAFEPPRFGGATTIGGVVATGLSGPARPFVGSTRDFVLGARILNGKGEELRFGGEVMKNVAGYDLSRLMCGAMGTLGLLLDVSLKVMPCPACEQTRVFHCDELEALKRINQLRQQPLPLSAACYVDGQLSIRLSGAEASVSAAADQIGGEQLEGAGGFWGQVRDLSHPFFSSDKPLWRLSLPQKAPSINTNQSAVFIDWGGAQRWVASEQPGTEPRAMAESQGGHASLFRGGDRVGDVFHPLSPALMQFHQRIKTALDPQGVFNPGRLYQGF